MAQADKQQLELSRATARSVNDAGRALLSDLDKAKSGDLFLSPPSIISALSLALAAAEPGSKCEQELREAISPSSGSTEEALKAVSSLCALFAPSSSASSPSTSTSSADSSGEGPIVETANSVWCHSRCREFSSEYLSLVSALGAEAKSLSSGEKEGRDDGVDESASARINSWVSQKTRKMIDNVIDEGTAARAEAILVNALYFKGRWKSKFDRQRSGPGDFFPSSGEEDGEKIRAHFMNKLFKRETGIKVLSKQGVVSLAVKLPYSTATRETPEAEAEAGEAAAPVDPGLFEAVFALPEPGASLSDALAALQGGNDDDDEGSSWQDPPRPGVDVSVPAFRCEAPCLRLSSSLKSALKLSAPFCQATCEFTRMFASSSEEAAPAIDEVLHKVAVFCDEEGTEAAAATAVVMMRAMLMVEEPLRFNADRPFLFVVRHAASGLDLFVGRVAGPKVWKDEDGERAAGVRPGAAPTFA